VIAGARVIPAVDGLRGFDCNRPLSSDDCQKFRAWRNPADPADRYAFAVRYVAREYPHPGDLTRGEVDIILGEELGLMVVQHVDHEDWLPTASMGGAYGAEAAREAIAMGIPSGVSMWCDLEGVNTNRELVPAQAVVDFCNRWQRSVALGGFKPGLYVGWHPGLNADQLFADLAFEAYWGAYNVDVVPVTRGFQMHQSAMLNVDRVPGITFEFDVNHVRADNLGGRPQILQPDPFADVSSGSCSTAP
jgi:hypothetical protein